MEQANNRQVERELDALPAVLRSSTARVLENFLACGFVDRVPASRLQPLVRMLACSEFAATVLQRETDWFLQQGALLDEPPDRVQLQQFARDVASRYTDPDIAQQDIRRYRNRYYLHLLWREYSGMATLQETLLATSDLADALLLAAVGFAERQVQERFGIVSDAQGAPVGLVVLGMGKLGGRELNLSSDIDLIFLYPGGNDSDGRKSLSPQEYFTRVSRVVVTVLEAPTADGFAFRVDTRLRPFGDSGPPVASFAALESYLLQHGRGWERYAYVKARVAGPQPAADRLADLYDNIILPFVYRRYLDYGVFESLREMHALISAEVQRRELADNVKLGPGGIREIEFVVQSLQLVRGGGQQQLQGSALLDILPRLAGSHDLSAADVDELAAAYRFLRRVENFIQAIRDQQTHDLPVGDVDRARLALAIGLGDWQQLAAKLEQHRNIVMRQFDKIAFRERAIDVDAEYTQSVQELWARSAEQQDWAAALQQEGFAAADELAEIICQFRATAAYADISANRRLEQFVPKLFALLRHTDVPQQTLRRVLSVAEKILRRSAYIALLNENDSAMAKLVELCARSDYVTRQVAQYPALLDELLDPGSYLSSLSRADMTAELLDRTAVADKNDSEAQMEILARFQRSMQFRVAIADYDGALPVMRVSDCLTELAETVIEYALRVAWRDLGDQYGEPDAAGFAIVAYGKFGGLELSYGSDLDLVFLHDSVTPGAMTNGARPLDHSMFFTRLVRRLVHFLTTRTASGVLYEVDTRLRPDGKSGLLVSNTEAFARYQEENAWTWEHQALLRARVVAGSDRIAKQFDDIRYKTLTAGLHKDTLRNDVLSMRARMRANLDNTDAEMFDLKQGQGGIGDIEFLVQYLVLANAAQHPAVIRFTDNIRQLDGLAENGLIDAADAARLQESYRRLRHRAHHLLLDDMPTRIPQVEFTELREFVGRMWANYLGGSGA